MGRVNKANLKKTLYYLKRNGIRKTWYAILERLEERRQRPYVWVPPAGEELEAQRDYWREGENAPTFSILVPLYRTKTQYLRELVESVRRQTYPGWELILADATEDDSVERILRDWGDVEAEFGSGDVEAESGGAAGRKAVKAESAGAPGRWAGEHARRIRYIRLAENAGISENTNQALLYATGDYAGLLDHDDILTENALHEMAAAIEAGTRRGKRPRMLYSDEDKCNGDRSEYYEPNFKEDFNLDLLLSNNYICHFLVMERELMQKLKLRREYEGAQDYDLVLRAAWALREEEDAIVHVPRVLYHWRCHTGSTAENPRSKLYAYENGRRAIQEFVRRAGWQAQVLGTAHVGFYKLSYQGDIFRIRTDVGAVGGRLVRKGRTVGGRLLQAGERPGGALQNSVQGGRGALADGVQGGSGALPDGVQGGGGALPDGVEAGGALAREGEVLYKNLPVHYSGYLHRAQLPQDACAVDIRNIRVRPECRELFRQVVGVEYGTVPGEEIFDASLLPAGCGIRQVSLELGRALRAAGYRILYLPEKEFDRKI